MTPSALDPRLQPAPLLVLDDELAVGAGIGRRHLDAVLGPDLASAERRGHLVIAHDVADMERKLCEPDRVPRGGLEAGRKRLRGAYLDVFLSRDRSVTIFDALDWLRDHYGCTPCVAFTAADAVFMREFCASRGAVLLDHSRMCEAQLAYFQPDDVRRAVIGLMRSGERFVPVVDKGALIETPEIFRFFESHLFAPWDARGIDVRRFLLHAAGVNAIELDEHLMRTLDAYFDAIPLVGLHTARGLKIGSLKRQLTKLRSIFGIRHLDELLAAYARATCDLPIEPPRADGKRRPSVRRCEPPRT